MSKKRVVVKQSKKVPDQLNYVGNLHLTDDYGRTLLEVRGLATVGRKKARPSDQKSGWKYRSYAKFGNTGFVAWENEHGEPSITISGGMHKTTANLSNSHERRKFMKFVVEALKLRVKNVKNGGYYVYVGKK